MTTAPDIRAAIASLRSAEAWSFPVCDALLDAAEALAEELESPMRVVGDVDIDRKSRAALAKLAAAVKEARQ